MYMLVLSHVVIALSSVFFAAYSLFSPSQNKLKVSYGLTTATLATGTYLVISTHSPLLQSCTTGLAYLAIIFSLIAVTRRRLAHELAKED